MDQNEGVAQVSSIEKNAEGGGLTAASFDPEFYLITFSSASHCIETEKKAKETMRIHIIPTPREITASCGMALRFQSADREEMLKFFGTLRVPSRIYAMGSREENGKRRAEKLGEK